MKSSPASPPASAAPGRTPPPTAASLTWTRKDLVATEDLSLAEIRAIHLLAAEVKEDWEQRRPSRLKLAGRSLVNLFLEPSTRTRVAFEMAAKRLGMDVITITTAASSLVKGETLRDTALNIQALKADGLVIRHSAAGSPLYLSRILRIPVVSAGDGAHEHPTQALLDTFTMSERLGDLTGRKIAILGDILYSRVARSNIWALRTLGARVILVGPSTLVPERLTEFGAEVSHDLREALAGADVVMLLRIQHERQATSHFPSVGEYTGLFGLNRLRASWLKPGALIMHPGPINRGVEIDSDLADSAQSVILQQVTNGIACRMAVLYLCLRAAEGDPVTVPLPAPAVRPEAPAPAGSAPAAGSVAPDSTRPSAAPVARPGRSTLPRSPRARKGSSHA